MERLQEGHINPFLYGDHISLQCLDQEVNALHQYYQQPHQMPFLHMLQERGLLLEVESNQPQPEPNSFQLLLRLQEEQLLLQRRSLPPQDKQPWPAEPDKWRPPPSSLELESCVTHTSESQSETCRDQLSFPEPFPTAADLPVAAKGFVEVEEREKERKKRKRCRTSKKAEEAESQRMSHIAVERNRRRLMNDHLSALRSLMPPSYIQRGDQASIVGGAIDFVKELEQHLQALQAEKQMRAIRSRSNGDNASSHSDHPFEGVFTSPQYTMHRPSSCSSSSSSTSSMSGTVKVGDEVEGCNGSPGMADIETTMIQTHVNLRVLVPRRPGQLVRAIAALEELHLVVLHLTITSVHDNILYSLNLKMEEECKFGSAEEIATAVHQIFSYISCTC